MKLYLPSAKKPTVLNIFSASLKASDSLYSNGKLVLVAKAPLQIKYLKASSRELTEVCQSIAVCIKSTPLGQGKSPAL
jgi:hypothetical protein